ncbi:hypothetical protein MMC25_002176 [Agyrium rufum]|nr:hypothetical protein [Agyrium rufum]
MGSVETYPSTYPVGAVHTVSSANGDFVAFINQSLLTIRSVADSATRLSKRLEKNLSESLKFLGWSNQSSIKATETDGITASPRVLLADNDNVHVYDLEDSQWHGLFSGASSGLGPISNVEFGSTKNEILVFSDFSVKLTIWSLRTSRGVEIRDPKFSGANGHALRSKSGHLAVLTRPSTRDTVLILAPGTTRELETSFELPSTDAQGLKWSPDGNWLAIWDSASSGTALFIYTAQGMLFNTYYGPENSENLNLGIKCIEWAPDGSYLAIGTNEAEVVLLQVPSFQMHATFQHGQQPNPSLIVPNGSIWQEQMEDGTRTSTYTRSPQPACPPGPSVPKDNMNKNILPNHSITNLHFSPSGNGSNGYLATRCAATPTTVYIWDLQSLTLTSVLIHHFPAVDILWHPRIPDLLLLHCAVTYPVLHLWSPTWATPRIIRFSLPKNAGRGLVSWLSESSSSHPSGIAATTAAATSDEPRPRILYANAHNYAIVRIPTENEMTNESGNATSQIMLRSGFTTPSGERSLLGPEDMFDEGNSMDLSPIKLSTGTFTRVMGYRQDEEIQDGEIDDGSVDDTFDFKSR